MIVSIIHLLGKYVNSFCRLYIITYSRKKNRSSDWPKSGHRKPANRGERWAVRLATPRPLLNRGGNLGPKWAVSCSVFVRKFDKLFLLCFSPLGPIAYRGEPSRLPIARPTIRPKIFNRGPTGVEQFLGHTAHFPQHFRWSCQIRMFLHVFSVITSII